MYPKIDICAWTVVLRIRWFFELGSSVRRAPERLICGTDKVQDKVEERKTGTPVANLNRMFPLNPEFISTKLTEPQCQ